MSLAPADFAAHIQFMATQLDSPPRKKGKNDEVLGRSAATGRFVMAPKSARGSITVKQANTAAKHAQTHKK